MSAEATAMKTMSSIFLQLEECPCCVCGERSGKTCLEGYDIEFRTCDNKFQFLECAGCHHIYLSPRPLPSEMEIIYRNYLTTNLDSAYYPSAPVAWIKDNLFDTLRLRPLLRHLHDGSNVLDVGAGAGRLLLLLRRISRAPINLYANDVAFDPMTQEKFAKENIHMLVGAVESCDSPVKFDVITGIHVIEHLLDPPAFLVWAYNHLNPGGLLYLETPDADTVLRRLFGSNWGHTHFPRHLNLFNKRSLARLAKEAGFTIRSQKNTTSAPAWNMSIRNTLKMDALTKHRSILEIFNYSNILSLGFFTLIDLTLMLVRIPTSTQQLVAVRL